MFFVVVVVCFVFVLFWGCFFLFCFVCLFCFVLFFCFWWGFFLVFFFFFFFWSACVFVASPVVLPLFASESFQADVKPGAHVTVVVAVDSAGVHKWLKTPSSFDKIQ